MSGLLPNVDPDGLLEYSVVFTDRSLNHMSQSFQSVVREISSTLKTVYQAKALAIVPGGGTYGMEAVARQLANDKQCLVVRNGWFSFRWSQILDAGNIASNTTVMMARQSQAGNDQAPFAPAPIDEVVAAIHADKPDLVFAPHVETSAGILLPDDYVKALAEAVHAVGGLLVLDCIASGALWIDMKTLGVDLLITAPQKGWSASPCAAMVLMSEAGLAAVENSTSTSFACDLKKWLQITQAYENGGHAYHATMPTDGLKTLCGAMQEAKHIGFEKLRQQQLELGEKVRALLEQKGFSSVAAEGFKAPGVVVSYTKDTAIQNGQKFMQQGLQTAAGVPLQCNEPDGFQTFRLGLFGLDKLADVDGAVARLAAALEKI